jgi:ribosomal protein S18 acetylase RimI-like enzyme
VTTSLIDAAVDAMRQMGVERLFLWVGEANRRARRFYDKGWKYGGSARPSPFGPTELRYTRHVRALVPE